jgi:hypothetical protein
VVAVLAVACGSSSHGSATAPSTSKSTTVPVVAPGVAGYTPFFLRGGPVSPGHRRPIDPHDPIGTALRTLIAGPDAVDQAAGLNTSLASDVVIEGLSLSKGVVTVDFSRRFESANTRPQVGEVVYTLTQFPGVHAVIFMVEGTPNGAAGVGPQTRADLADMTPPILPVTPAPADRLGRTFRCAGLTQVRGPIVCTVKTPNGKVLASSSFAAPTTTSTTTTMLGVAGGNGLPSVEFDSVVTLATPYHGPANVVVAQRGAVYGMPIVPVAVIFS